MRITKFYKKYCRSPLVKPLAQLGKSVNLFYENRNYHCATNGELRVVEILGAFGGRTVFDVGANIGSWTEMTLAHFPGAQFFCFEPIPDTYQRLRKIESPRVKTFPLGLGEISKKAVFHFYPEGHELSSEYRLTLHAEKPREVDVTIVQGDEFLKQHGIERIDFLKIDSEGSDLSILKGFEGALREKRVGAIQFEYGRINIISKALLHEFYEFLAPMGFAIGKIYPHSVAFADYHFEMEDFIGPNYLAIPRDRLDLIQALQ